MELVSEREMWPPSWLENLAHGQGLGADDGRRAELAVDALGLLGNVVDGLFPADLLPLVDARAAHRGHWHRRRAASSCASWGTSPDLRRRPAGPVPARAGIRAAAATRSCPHGKSRCPGAPLRRRARARGSRSGRRSCPSMLQQSRYPRPPMWRRRYRPGLPSGPESSARKRPETTGPPPKQRRRHCPSKTRDAKERPARTRSENRPLRPPTFLARLSQGRALALARTNIRSGSAVNKIP